MSENRPFDYQNFDAINFNATKPKSNLYGYMRLSKRDLSKLDAQGRPLTDEELVMRQRRELILFGVPEENIFSEGILSGVGNKPVLYSMLGLSKDSDGKIHQSGVCSLPKGSTLCVCELSRLSRDKLELSQILRILEDSDVSLMLLDCPMLTELKSEYSDNKGMNWIIRKLVLTLLIYMADEERKTLIERTKKGLETAKAQGKVLGRPSFNTPERVHSVYEKYSVGEISWADGAKLLGLGKTQFYKLMSRERAKAFVE